MPSSIHSIDFSCFCMKEIYILLVKYVDTRELDSWKGMTM